jgi:hypothetical protein
MPELGQDLAEIMAAAQAGMLFSPVSALATLA